MTTVLVNDELGLESGASCVVKRKHWSDTIVDEVLARVKEEQRSKSERELRELDKKAKVDARNKAFRHQMFVALKTGYYNRIDSDNYERFAEEEARTASNGIFN